jgi:hypothetical protein
MIFPVAPQPVKFWALIFPVPRHSGHSSIASVFTEVHDGISVQRRPAEGRSSTVTSGIEEINTYLSLFRRAIASYQHPEAALPGGEKAGQ